MGYLLLAIAIILELAATTALKFTEGFTRLFPTLGCMVLYGVCFFSLSKALNYINLSVAYATWCGLGVVLTALISVVIFKENLNFMSVLGIFLVISGVVILNLFGKMAH